MTSPATDESLEHLAQYLTDKLNTMQPQVIASWHIFDEIPTDPAAYPALILHRTESRGEAFQQCSALLKYMMLNQTERRARPGLFRWLELAIAKCLREYEWIEDAPIRLRNLPSLRSRYRIGSAGNALFPFLEITLEFGDLTDL
jgi:hypothetical protein